MQATIGCRSNSAEAELKAAQSSLKQTEADEKRYAALNEKTWVSDASYEQKKATADEARGRVERAVGRFHSRRTSSPIRISWPLKPA